MEVSQRYYSHLVLINIGLLSHLEKTCPPDASLLLNNNLHDELLAVLFDAALLAAHLAMAPLFRDAQLKIEQQQHELEKFDVLQRTLVSFHAFGIMTYLTS